MRHKTNLYRRQDKSDAYEVMVRWIHNMSDELLSSMLCDENVVLLRESYPTLSRQDSRQIIAKAVRVERGRQLAELRLPEMIE
jgi:hypothetical protein